MVLNNYFHNDNYSYNISYRNIKYPRIELKTGNLLFVLPFGYKDDNFFDKHRRWIYKKINFIEKCLKSAEDKKLVERTDDDFISLINKFTKELSSNLKVKINKIFLRKMKTKWASLSSHKNLTVNKFTKYLPDYLIEYIIFHELAHVIEKKHNTRFWSIIEARYKNHQEFEKELFEYWFKISNIPLEDIEILTLI